MCKRINRFIPVLFVSSIVLTILAGAVIAVTGVNIPLWGQLSYQSGNCTASGTGLRSSP